MKQQLNIGLFGFGVVGNGLYEVLQKSQTAHAEIRKICVKNRTKRRQAPESLFCFEPSEILDDPEINLVVELIDDADAAYEIVKSALLKGKSVVSGNKKMLAVHLPELIDIQNKYGVGLLYDASACGSIPVIRNLEEYYDNDLLQSVTGILNGSSNYILSRMFSQNLDYREALFGAQELGFAESDPFYDVEGLDALYKLVIITVHAFGVYIAPEQIFHSGISKISENDIGFAKEKGSKIKLVARVLKTGPGKISLSVLPMFVKPEKYIFNVEDEFNGVVIKGAFYDKQFMFGKGAGGFPTGSAVLSDITARGYNYRYEYKKMKQQPDLKLDNDHAVKIYLRFTDKKDLDIFGFESILEQHYAEGFNYVIGKISLEALFKARPEMSTKDIFLAEIS
jgi:homoserine dehydrogenase